MAFRPAIEPESSVELYRSHVHSIADLERFLNHCVRQKVSDIFLQTNEPAVGHVYGEPFALTGYNFQQTQIDDIAALITGNNNIKTSLAAGRDFNHAFDVRDMDNTDEHGVNARLRFRLCATAISGRGGEAKQFVMRHIPATPPPLNEVGFPSELMDEFAIQQGAFLIAGETGSGKTTTFAACIRHILEGKTPIKGNIVTYESPIEYVFSDIQSDTCTIAQSEIGLHIPSFHAGVVNAMRRKPSLVVVGELKEPASIQAAVDVAVSGHPVFATVHANDSSSIIRRMIMQYDVAQQTQMFSELCSTSRLLMSQLLVPRHDKPGRVCLRDWVILDPERSEQLASGGYAQHHRTMQDWMTSGIRARSMRKSIDDELEAGRISEETARLCYKRYGFRVA